MDTHHSSAYGTTEVLEEQRNYADPRTLTTQGSRFDNSWQPPDYGKRIADLEALCYKLEARMTNLEKNIEQRDKKNRDWSHSVNTRLQDLESSNRAFPGKAVRKDLQEKEENEKLKEEIKKLEARNRELLSKAMAVHKHSEDMNDPSRLSVVLKGYEMLQLREWEKVRTSTPYRWTYEQGSYVIKRLFYACEEDLQQRISDIFQVLGFPPSNDTMTNSKQGIIREIRNLFGQSYYQNHSEVYREIAKDPPVKATWNTERWTEDLEHVDKKDVAYWKNPAFLWPIMKRGEQTIVKGVVWDKE